MLSRKKRKYINVDKDHHLPVSPELQRALAQRIREKYIAQLSDRERAERLDSQNPRERRASEEHEARLAKERERLASIEAKEKRRVSLITEPLAEMRLLAAKAGNTRRRSSNVPRKGRRRSSIKRQRRKSLEKSKRRSVGQGAPQGTSANKLNSEQKPSQLDKKPEVRSPWASDSALSNSELFSDKDEPAHPFKGTPRPPRRSTVTPAQVKKAQLVILKETESSDQAKDNRRVSKGQAKESASVGDQRLIRKDSVRRILPPKDRCKEVSNINFLNQEELKAYESLDEKRNKKLVQKEREIEQKFIGKQIAAVIPPGASTGLLLLNKVENVFLQHKKFVGEGEGCSCPTTVNVYQFVNIHGNKLFRVTEESVKKTCCGMFREIVYSCFDEDNVEVGAITESPVACGSTKRRLKVFSPPKHLLGFVEQKRFGWFGEPKVDITDHEGYVYAGIRLEPEDHLCCTLGGWAWMCRKHKIFAVKTLRGSPRGRIRDDWNEQPFTHCGVHFPADMNIVVKILIMAATILVYDQFYEQQSTPLHKDPRKNKKQEQEAELRAPSKETIV